MKKQQKKTTKNSYLALYPRGDEMNSRMIWVSLGGFENHLISELGMLSALRRYPRLPLPILALACPTINVSPWPTIVYYCLSTLALSM